MADLTGTQSQSRRHFAKEKEDRRILYPRNTQKSHRTPSVVLVHRKLFSLRVAKKNTGNLDTPGTTRKVQLRHRLLRRPVRLFQVFS